MSGDDGMPTKYQLRQLARRVAAENGPVRFARWARGASTYTPVVMRNAISLVGPINTVIDVGASDGRWSKRYRKLAPEAEYLLFEGNPIHYASLDRYAARAGAHVEHAAASDHVGEVHFYIDPANPLGGAASTTGFDDHDTVVPTKPIDDAVAERGLKGPFLLKLDTQGHEREIFAGAEGVLKEAALVIVEVYGVDDPGRMAFDEMCAMMRVHGFRAAAIADPVNRPSDGMLWQMDMVFIRADHPAYLDHRFH